MTNRCPVLWTSYRTRLWLTQLLSHLWPTSDLVKGFPTLHILVEDREAEAEQKALSPSLPALYPPSYGIILGVEPVFEIRVLNFLNEDVLHVISQRNL